MTADADQAVELHALRADLEAMRELLVAMSRSMAPQTLPPHLQRVVVALATIYGTGTAFRSGEVADALHLAPQLQNWCELRAALHAVDPAHDLTAQRVGLVIRQAFTAGGRTSCGLHLLRPTTENGSAVWVVARVQGT